MCDTMIEPVVLNQLLSNIREYDENILTHSVRVCHLCNQLGQQLGFSDQKLNILRNAAILHDYGKIFIPKDILMQARLLTNSERYLVNYHVRFGIDKLRHVKGVTEDMLEAVRTHHERLDGTGYPRGVTEISDLGRVLCVADVFDALTHKRCYKGPMPREHALAIMEEGRGDKYDGGVIDALQEIADSFQCCAECDNVMQFAKCSGC